MCPVMRSLTMWWFKPNGSDLPEYYSLIHDGNESSSKQHTLDRSTCKNLIVQTLAKWHAGKKNETQQDSHCKRLRATKASASKQKCGSSKNANLSLTLYTRMFLFYRREYLATPDIHTWMFCHAWSTETRMFGHIWSTEVNVWPHLIYWREC